MTRNKLNNLNFLINKIMEQWTAPACGSIRIKKATTLQSWIDKGWYQREINDGYTFAPACGRFRLGKCECSRCEKPNGGWEKKVVLERNGLLNGL